MGSKATSCAQSSSSFQYLSGEVIIYFVNQLRCDILLCIEVIVNIIKVSRCMYSFQYVVPHPVVFQVGKLILLTLTIYLTNKWNLIKMIKTN